ncbi:hypothetical protein AGABI1DRAFT_83018 [Agaricus bisporus var. burnettii JB137-S8]|uniref:Uncharacterized protein n=1 Tax=Agaricus bisporus var. burnettii (strain JB137-S8 / ATCC MYA-4627 / FGSC 10392) TaxID=597362 RepID=K5XDW7_AGABU|nr:uncharacterized protein AGABI1DRAFT_83018 [Agaricus bisporus var. burnettii JB137-S8]EKM81528.1 hypothetical protein AGABI1DRAFT_83018 [Agaricus bisporus var. burnettii JB137-S8]
MYSYGCDIIVLWCFYSFKYPQVIQRRQIIWTIIRDEVEVFRIGSSCISPWVVSVKLSAGCLMEVDHEVESQVIPFSSFASRHGLAYAELYLKKTGIHFAF